MSRKQGPREAAMRPPANAASRRQRTACTRDYSKEAA